MRLNISKLKTDKSFENEKIKISFSTGEVSNSLSVYLFDENKKQHHIIWKIDNDRCHQNFDKANEKIRVFVDNKIQEWIREEEKIEEIKAQNRREREIKEKSELKKLADSF
ncbi:hypothetical protein LDL76_08830 [Salegentibacter mishustinae]|uniref:hypothetical protein n=1 Tax=Salegentibacter mishustinae TaxID=270918 RepID=UPI001CE20FF2|nr:hypothetical protein [Salegentibacter mishustinae]UBZ05478.1 hypothetical protein LDL76_08830 [Salegentibacter mishustinae]